MRSEKTTHSMAARWLLRTGLAYVVLLIVSLWLPLGLHRVIMGRQRAWLFPAAYALLGVGVVIWFALGRQLLGAAALLACGAPYFILLVRDLFGMSLWGWPFEWTVAEKFEALDTRFHVRLNLSLAVIIAVAMAWLARTA